MPQEQTPKPRQQVDVVLDTQTDTYRLIDKATGAPALNTKTGTPLDGGGHENQAKAERQMSYINGTAVTRAT